MNILDAIRGAIAPPVPPHRVSRRNLQGGQTPDWFRVHDRVEEFVSEMPLPRRSVCRVRVWTDLAGVCAPVVIMSDQGRGVHVTNFVEAIAPAVASRLALPAQTIWITHVPAEFAGGELYQVVTFSASTDVRDLSGAETAWVKTLAGDTREER